MSERTLVLIKPDAVRRRLVGEIISRLERKDLTIEAMVLRTMDAELADAHYAEHVAKPFYPTLKAFMTSGPLVAMIVSGDTAIEVVRALVGATDGRKAAPGTHPGRLLPVQHGKPHPRLGLAGQRQARDRALVPRARLSVGISFGRPSHGPVRWAQRHRPGNHR